MNLYKNVKQLCDENDISVMKLERTLGFQRSSISKWDKHIPGINRVKMVADYFGITIDELIRDSDEVSETAES